VQHGVPRVPSWNIRRTRLLAQLDPELPLLLVQGPTGSGKSSLLADWARTRHPAQRPLVWVDVASASTRAGLWSELTEVLVEARLARPQQVQPGNDPQARTGRLAALRAIGPLTVVLDGYRRPSDIALDRELVETVRDCPSLQVVVAARVDLRPLRELATLTVDLADLGPADLALDLAEVGAVLERAGQDPAAAPAVHRVTGGLAVAVRMLVVAATHHGVSLVAATDEQLTDVATAGVLAALAPEADPEDRTLRVARRLSVTTAVTRQLAADLVGERVDDVLDQLAAEGLGSWRAGPLTTFELTPVVRRALRTDLDRDEPESVDPLLRTVVSWGLAEQQFHPALRAAVATGDPDLIGSVLVTLLASGRTAYRPETIHVLRQLPTTTLARDPLLAFFVALLYNAEARNRPRAVEWFGLTVAAIAYRLPRADEHERTVLQLGEAVVLRLLGRADRATAAARTALARLDLTPRGESRRIDALQGVAHRQLGLTLVAAGHLAEGAASIERALAYEQPGSPGELTGHSLLAGLAAAQSQLRVAAEHVAVTEALTGAASSIASYQHVMLELARITLALEAGALDEAEQRLEAAAAELTTNEFWPAFARVQVYLDLLRRRPALGEERLVEAMGRGRRAPLSTYWRSGLEASRALLALATGQGERGLALLEPLPSSHPEVRVARARLLLSTGRQDAALALLASADLPDEGPRLRAARRFLLAAASHRANRTRTAQTAAQEAVALSRVAGTRAGWLLLGETERTVLVDLLEPAADDQIGTFLAEVAAVPTVLPGRVAAADLSERESVVLRYLAEDLDLTGVAARLQVSPNTVKSQVRGIYRKLGVGSRRDALARAQELGLL
jgi:LuxR family maltose regulon positive regulatory protein